MNFIKDEVTGKYRVDRLFFWIGRWIWIPVCIFGFWFAYGSGFQDYGDLFACSFKEITKLPCPGCGGTRAFFYLFRGDILTSIRMNITVLYAVIAYLHFMGWFIYRHYIRKERQKEIPIQFYLYGTAVIVIGQWLVKLVIIFT